MSEQPTYEALKKRIRELEEEAAALTEDRERFLSIFETIPAVIDIVEPNTFEVLFANQFTRELYGQDIVGKPCYRVFHNFDSPCSFCNNEQILKDKDKVLHWEYHSETADRDFATTNRIIGWPDGREVKFEFSIDITQRKMLEAGLRQSHKMQALGTLAGGIAHDFNNILGIIIGNTELAMDHVPEWAPTRINLEEIQTAGFRAKNLVKQLLSFSRMPEGRQKPIRLSPLIRESVGLIRASLPAAIEIQERITAASDAVLGDPALLRQLMVNLCTNSAQAMANSGGRIEIELADAEPEDGSPSGDHDVQAKAHVRLTIRDTGPGIPADIRDRIFDPYFTTREVGQGSGMGLAVVHGIVQNHCGSITVDSAPGRGTAVHIRLPVVELKDAPIAPVSKPAPGGNESILFVDDEQSIADMGWMMLSRLGYHVIAKTDPEQALEVFRERSDQFDLLVTDMTMPRMNGDQLVKEALRIRPDMPIILCTGYSDKMSRDRARNMGIRKYIEKPFNKTFFAEAVRTVLDQAKGDPP